MDLFPFEWLLLFVAVSVFVFFVCLLFAVCMFVVFVYFVFLFACLLVWLLFVVCCELFVVCCLLLCCACCCVLLNCCVVQLCVSLTLTTVVVLFTATMRGIILKLGSFGAAERQRPLASSPPFPGTPSFGLHLQLSGAVQQSNPAKTLFEVSLKLLSVLVHVRQSPE